jgi:hypothetical protein
MGTNSSLQHRRRNVTCVATRFGFVRIEQQWKPRRQRSFVYVAVTVGCLFSRLALCGRPGGGGGGCDVGRTTGTFGGGFCVIFGGFYP